MQSVMTVPVPCHVTNLSLRFFSCTPILWNNAAWKC